MGIYIFISIVVILFGVYIIQNLYRKYSDLEERVEDYENFITNLHGKINKVNEEIKRLDNKKMFEDDDEVGIIFKAIENIINTLTFELEKGE